MVSSCTSPVVRAHFPFLLEARVNPCTGKFPWKLTELLPLLFLHSLPYSYTYSPLHSFSLSLLFFLSLTLALFQSFSPAVFTVTRSKVRGREKINYGYTGQCTVETTTNQRHQCSHQNNLTVHYVRGKNTPLLIISFFPHFIISHNISKVEKLQIFSCVREILFALQFFKCEFNLDEVMLIFLLKNN